MIYSEDETRDQSQGMQAPLEARKGKEMDCPLSLQRNPVLEALQF